MISLGNMPGRTVNDGTTCQTLCCHKRSFRSLHCPTSVLEINVVHRNLTRNGLVNYVRLEGRLLTILSGYSLANNPEGGMPFVDNGDGTVTLQLLCLPQACSLEVAVGEGNVGGSGVPMLRIDRVPEKGSLVGKCSVELWCCCC